MKVLLKKNDTILFQGDSITDSGRDRNDPNSMGVGYVLFTTSWLSALYPELDLKFINKGINGDRTCDLVRRWDDDCIILKPDLISIYVGINDIWRRYDSNDPTSTEEFENNYRILLDRIFNELNVKVILCEPFVLPYPEDRKMWREDMDPKIEVIHKLSKEYNISFVPLDAIFKDGCKLRAPEYWAGD